MANLKVICPFCKVPVDDLDEHLRKSFAVDVRKEIAKAKQRDHPVIDHPSPRIEDLGKTVTSSKH